MNTISIWLLAALAGTLAPGAPEQPKAKVMILGVYHFDSPNLDLLKSEVVDHLSETKQAEIAEVLDRLGAFKPTKIVLEAAPDALAFQERYQSFRKNATELGGDEREQLGFNLARQFDHPRVYFADYKLDMDFDRLMAAARESKDERFVRWFQESMRAGQALLDRQSRLTLLEALRMLNEPALLGQLRDMYLQFARVHAAERHVGAEILADWYKRNFCIFDNVARAVDSPQDRVLVIFGQGHAPYLRELVQSSPDMELIEPNLFLKD